MEIRLARANSLVDIENNGGVNMVTGLPAAVMERVSLIASQSTELFPSFTPKIERLIVLSKDRKHQVGQYIFPVLYLNSKQISLMHEEEQYRYNTDLLNDYFERDLLERAEHDALVQAYRELEEGSYSTHNE